MSDKPMTTDQKVLTYSLKQSDRYKLTDYLDESPVTCFSIANKFIGYAVKEKGVRYFFPKGCKIMLVKGELICFVHEPSRDTESEPAESMA